MINEFIKWFIVAEGDADGLEIRLKSTEKEIP
jgi:hypothetical protein